MKIYFHTFGCKVNQYETQLMRQYLLTEGYTAVSADENPDIIIINSCSVTKESERKCLQFLRKMKKNNPDAIIVLSGCMTQVKTDFSAFSDVDIIIGNKHHKSLPSLLNEFFMSRTQIIKVDPHNVKGEDFEECAVSDFDEHTRAFIKIEDGCNRFCSYCIIPYARGRVRSKSIDDIHSEVKNLADKGYKEIVLVGINLSAYGEDINLTLADAVENLTDIENIRIRLGSLEADLLNEDFIKRLSECKNLCPQFHLSLQSGCDSTLKRMNRKYSSADFENLVKSIYKYFDNPSITTDIIVGFPGETEDDFIKSLEFAKKMNFARSHIFPYSVRPGTVAEKMENQVPKNVKSERCKKMIDEMSKCEIKFLESQIGKECSVLFERTIGEYTVGYSENYCEVKIKNGQEFEGKIVKVKITDKDDENLCLYAEKSRD